MMQRPNFSSRPCRICQNKDIVNAFHWGRECVSNVSPFLSYTPPINQQPPTDNVWQLILYGYVNRFKFPCVIDPRSTISISPLKFVNKIDAKLRNIFLLILVKLKIFYR